MTRKLLLSFMGLALMGFVTAGAVSAADGDEAVLATEAAEMDSVAAAHGEAVVTDRISADFSAFAGSTENADALVQGLRNGTEVTVTTVDAAGVETSATFAPPTGQMGHGNVYTSLALAKEQLASVGITEPTAEEIQAAMVGGDVVTATGETQTLPGVLQLRSEGMGWGEIAHEMGFKLGPVISGMRTGKAQVDGEVDTTADTDTTGPSNADVVTGVNGKADVSAGARGKGNAYGKGVVTGTGGASATAHGEGVVRGSGDTGGNAYGKGIVTGTGGGAGNAYGHGEGPVSGSGNAHGQGIVTGAGGGAGNAYGQDVLGGGGGGIVTGGGNAYGHGIVGGGGGAHGHGHTGIKVK